MHTPIEQAGVLAVEDPQALAALCAAPGPSNNQDNSSGNEGLQGVARYDLQLLALPTEMH